MRCNTQSFPISAFCVLVYSNGCSRIQSNLFQPSGWIDTAAHMRRGWQKKRVPNEKRSSEFSVRTTLWQRTWSTQLMNLRNLFRHSENGAPVAFELLSFEWELIKNETSAVRSRIIIIIIFDIRYGKLWRAEKKNEVENLISFLVQLLVSGVRARIELGSRAIYSCNTVGRMQFSAI